MKNEEKKIISGRTAYNIIEFLTVKKKYTYIYLQYSMINILKHFLNLSKITTVTLTILILRKILS